MRLRNVFRGLNLRGIAAVLFLLGVGCARVCAMDAKAMQAMVIVEGDKGRGSAFVVKMDGKTFLVTNSHVVRGNTNVKFKNLRKEVLATGPLQIADRVDAVRAEFTGTAQSLELAKQIEQKVKIGDAVIVAGNSEGEGVVREIPGKVVGIGPDRIEVDAEFVPGNSGSPILLKSTGEVIGVATYMKVPFSTRGGQKSPFSLNEVRRFGYRLDTVAKWVSPQPPDRIVQEGMRLAEMENVMSSIFSVLSANASAVSKWGSGSLISKEQRAKSPNATALAAAVDGFVKQHAAAKNDDEKKKNTADFFEKLKSVVVEDVRGLREDSFSGYYAVQFKEHMAQQKDFIEWFEGTGMPAFREAWLASKPQFDFFITNSVRSKPKIDPAKLKFVLADRVEPNEPADYCHHVFYPAASQPANLDDIYWIIERPTTERTVIKMHKANLRVRTSDIGTYRVYVEYRGDQKPRVVSNVVEVKFTAVTAAAAGLVPAAPAEKANPAATDAETTSKPGRAAASQAAAAAAGGLPDWGQLAERIGRKEWLPSGVAGHRRDKVTEDLGGQNSILIGFDVAITPFGKSQETVRGISPIFLAKDGDAKGGIYGEKNRKDVRRIVAKPGYAVGAVSAQFDGMAYRRMKVRFDRIKGFGLDPKDTYETDWIGTYPDTLKDGKADTDGRLPVGIAISYGLGVDGIGLLSLKP